MQPHYRSGQLHVQITDQQGVVFDELAPRLHMVTHQRREDFIGCHHILDPNLHQAVANIPSDQPNGTIASCFQPGWKIGERTLRAAMVAVSAGAAN